MSGLRGRAAPPWLLLRCACLALAPHRILPGFPSAGGSRECWVCAADGSCACCQCPYRRLWQMRRGCCLVRFYSYAVPRTRAQCSSRCIPSSQAAARACQCVVLGLRGRAAPPWPLLCCACLALAPHRILPGFPSAGGSRQCWVCAADGSCARCQCP